MVKRKFGFYKDLPNDIYHQKDGYLSSTVLKTALEDPLEYYRVYVKGLEPSKKISESAKHVGNYVHTAVLEPEKLLEDCLVYPGSRRQGKAWKQFEFDNSDKYIITSTEKKMVDEMLEEYKHATMELNGEQIKVSELFREGEPELSLFTEIDGLPIKVRFDYLIEGIPVIRDLKTTSACPDDTKTARQICYDYGYYLSAALYKDALKIETGLDADFQLIFMSKTNKRINVFKVSEKSLEYGRKMYKQAIKDILHWRNTGEYPDSEIREI